MSPSLAFGENLKAWASANRGQSILGRCLEFGTQESIKDGIQATVEICQGFSNGDPFVHNLLKVTAILDDSKEDKGVYANANVVW